MLRTIPIALICSLLLSAQSYGQDVIVPRQSKALPKFKKEETPAAEMPKSVAAKAPETSESKKAESEKTQLPKSETASASTKKDVGENSHPARASAINFEPVRALSAKEPAPTPSREKVRPAKAETSKSSAMNDSEEPAESKIQPAKAEPAKKMAPKESIASSSVERSQSPKVEPTKSEPAESTKNSVSKKSVASADSEKKQAAKSEPAHTKEAVVSVNSEKKIKAESTKEPAAKATASTQFTAEKNRPAKVEQTKPAVAKETQEELPKKEQVAKGESTKEPTTKATASNQSATEKVRSAKVEQSKPSVVKENQEEQLPKKERVAKIEPTKPPGKKEKESTLQSEKEETKGIAATVTKQSDLTLPKSEPIKASFDREPNSISHLGPSVETASTRLADGFDFPVGKPEAEGYYKARGFRPNGHAGEDWDGVRGGDTDLKDPIYCIGDGIVVFARDVHMGWGKVVIVRHGYKEDGGVRYIDSLYGHLDSILVKNGQKIRRGQQIATMGTAHGQYDAHLHFEIRKNIEIGMSKSKFSKNYSNYFSPTEFIVAHRHVPGGGTTFRVAVNTFTHDAAFHFDNAPNYSARKRSTAESSAALKRAISSTSGSDRD